MIKNYFVRELRNLINNKAIAALKICGLVIGLWVFIIAGYYTLHETSFDYFQDTAENKFSLESSTQYGGITITTPLPYVLCESLSDRYPEVIRNTSFKSKIASIYVKQEDNLVKSSYSEIGFVERSFFDFFNFKFVAGNAEESFKTSNPLIISEDIARRNFGKADIIGTPISLVVDGQVLNYTITGVIKNPASNSNVNFHWIGSLSHFNQAQNKKDYKSDWYYLCNNFVELLPGASCTDFSEKLSHDYVRLGQLEQAPKVLMTGLCKLHINKNLRIIITLGIIILLISIINYVLISTFEKTKQMRYWGIEKVSGAKKVHLLLKNSISTFFYTFVAFIITVILFMLSKHYFPSFISSNVPFNAILDTKKILIGALLCILFIILLSSIINQSIVGDLNPIDIIKNKFSKGKASKYFFNSLLSIQLVAFIALISATMLIQKQLSFMQESDMGFNKESLISMYISPDDVHSYNIFKTELLKNPNIKNICGTNSLPLSELSNNYFEVFTDSLGNQLNKTTEYIYVDSDFFNTLEVFFVQGNNFTENASSQCVVNQSFIEDRNLKDPLNKSIKLGGKEYNICGVVKDFHNKSMQMAINPFVAHYNPEKISKVIIRFSGNPKKTISQMQKEAKKYLHNTIFEYEFFDQYIKKVYESEIRFGNIITLLTILSIIISILGLIGVSFFSSQLRNKEIGIRKVSGAEVSEILVMLNRDFVILVAIGFLIAMPLTNYTLNNWLKNFAYKTDLSLWIFVLSGFIAVVIVMLTVSLQSWRSATRNPVEALRHE